VQGGVDIDFTGGMLVCLANRPQFHREWIAAELEAFAFAGSGSRKQGGGRPAWAQQLRVEEPLDRRLPPSCWDKHLEEPLLPLLPDPLELPEPLLQQSDGGEGQAALIALQPHFLPIMMVARAR
jgi:hypothetical protein